MQLFNPPYTRRGFFAGDCYVFSVLWVLKFLFIEPR
jgi:hypothetical protein